MARAPGAFASAVRRIPSFKRLNRAALLGHARMFVHPAYARLVTSEPFVRRLIPSLIVIFVATLGIMRGVALYEKRQVVEVDDIGNIAGQISMATPNRVYALIRSFAAANPSGFNRADGAGYRFLTSVIATVDKDNPSVAARLATGFRSFGILEEHRRAAAEAALTALSAAGNLSRDVADIVDRTLDGGSADD